LNDVATFLAIPERVDRDDLIIRLREVWRSISYAEAAFESDESPILMVREQATSWPIADEIGI
jgi:hypothetical protein